MDEHGREQPDIQVEGNSAAVTFSSAHAASLARFLQEVQNDGDVETAIPRCFAASAGRTSGEPIKTGNRKTDKNLRKKLLEEPRGTKLLDGPQASKLSQKMKQQASGAGGLLHRNASNHVQRENSISKLRKTVLKGGTEAKPNGKGLLTQRLARKPRQVFQFAGTTRDKQPVAAAGPSRVTGPGVTGPSAVAAGPPRVSHPSALPAGPSRASGISVSSSAGPPIRPSANQDNFRVASGSGSGEAVDRAPEEGVGVCETVSGNAVRTDGMATTPSADANEPTRQGGQGSKDPYNPLSKGERQEEVEGHELGEGSTKLDEEMHDRKGINKNQHSVGTNEERPDDRLPVDGDFLDEELQQLLEDIEILPKGKEGDADGRGDAAAQKAGSVRMKETVAEKVQGGGLDSLVGQTAAAAADPPAPAPLLSPTTPSVAAFAARDPVPAAAPTTAALAHQREVASKQQQQQQGLRKPPVPVSLEWAVPDIPAHRKSAADQLALLSSKCDRVMEIRMEVKRHINWKEELPLAQEGRRAVLLQNVDVQWHEEDLKDALQAVFDGVVAVKLYPVLTTPAAGTTCAVVVMKDTSAARKVISALKTKCVMAAAEGESSSRPLIGWMYPKLRRLKNETPAPGFLLLESLALQAASAADKAIATSHCAQPNTIEFELGVEWRRLQLQHEMQLELMAQIHDEELAQLC